MTKGGKSYRRQLFYAAPLIALVALAFPVSQSIASSRSNTATAPVERHTFNCGYTGGRRAIGTAKFTRTKSDSLIVDFTVTGADPTGGYYLYLYSNSPYYCDTFKFVGNFKVGSDGHAHKVVEVTGVAGYNDFFVAAYNATSDAWDTSTFVTI
jgi:hypothetical protein